MTAGTIGELETKTRDLQAEIAELEDRRRPLVLALDTSARSGFLCTGSMEPTITCLDEATWLRDFRPEDIAIGATIAFKPNCWEDDEDARGAAHRVMDIRVEEGIHYYWPKGDGAREPDGCWVPHTNVQGYVIDIHRDVRPANAVLRERGNAGKGHLPHRKDCTRRYAGRLSRSGGVLLWPSHSGPMPSRPRPTRASDRCVPQVFASQKLLFDSRAPVEVLATQRLGLRVSRPHPLPVWPAASAGVAHPGTGTRVDH